MGSACQFYFVKVSLHTFWETILLGFGNQNKTIKKNTRVYPAGTNSNFGFF
jgi:hypothetical protein